MPTEEELIARAEALLARGPLLPPPAERKRLREAAGLTQQQVATALRTKRETVNGWETGRTTPRPPRLAAYQHLLNGWAEKHPQTRASTPTPDTATATATETFTGTTAAPPADTPTSPTADTAATASRPARTAKPSTSSRRPGAKKPAPSPSADPRFENGPLAVVDANDGQMLAYCVGDLVLDCPAKTFPTLVEWALTEAKLGAPRLNRNGKDADPLLVLTDAAAERLGLPAVLEDRRGLRLAEDHKVVKQLAKAKWKLTKRGFGPWARVYRPAEGGKRQCVQFAILPWGALDTRSWGDTGQLPPADVAAVLGTYATRVLTPRGSTAVCGLELMSALRPPTRAVKDPATGSWVSGPNPGSLTEPVDPAPPEAPAEHPLVAALYPRHHVRTPDQVIDEEAYDWFRPLTDEECTQGYTHAVGLDVNMAFAAAANRLVIGTGPATHVENPVFDAKLPGSWLVDLSHIETDPRLPSPFTPKGTRPTGPAWYSTSTVAYAVELGATIEPSEAYVRHEHGAYFDGWYARLRDAYMATMADLGVDAGMSEADFLDAMARHKSVDPGQAAVLSAIKSTVKGGIGKLRERPQSIKHKFGEPWPALSRATWSPHARAELIGKVRTNQHRKLTAWARAGLFPVAILSDCAVYLSHGPSPLDFMPHTDEGKPLPGGFRLGVSPGMVKHEGTRDFLWLARTIEEEQINPARHIKGDDAPDSGE
ncbi:helix-turn-helix transcriptional regulator [Streptomyces decoyicus]|uniref:telomere-associated protein Tap n=1 Tax=Streptomyces decoyicus TaxID=249567 RepID=UPI0033F220F4